MTTRARDVAAGATRQTFVYTATGGQTTFSGNDANGNALQYNNDKVDVFLNGTRLSPLSPSFSVIISIETKTSVIIIHYMLVLPGNYILSEQWCYYC